MWKAAESRQWRGCTMVRRLDLECGGAELWEGTSGALRCRVVRVPPVGGRVGHYLARVTVAAGSRAGEEILVQRAATWEGTERLAELAWSEALRRERRERETLPAPASVVLECAEISAEGEQ